MKIYITGLPSGYEVEHLVRLFYPMAPLTLTPPEEGEDCVWAEKKEDSLYAMVREQGQSRDAAAPLPRPVEAGGETVEFTLASLTYDLLRSWTGIRPPWGKMTGVRPVRLIHDKRAAGWTEADIDRFFLERFDCSRQKKYDMAKAIADLQPILKLGSAPKTYSLYLGIPFCPSRCSYCSFVSCNLDRDRKLVQPYVDCLVQRGGGHPDGGPTRREARSCAASLSAAGHPTPACPLTSSASSWVRCGRTSTFPRWWSTRWRRAAPTAPMPKSWLSSKSMVPPAFPSTPRPSRTRCLPGMATERSAPRSPGLLCRCPEGGP